MQHKNKIYKNNDNGLLKLQIINTLLKNLIDKNTARA
jgi:hypothetical protein